MEKLYIVTHIWNYNRDMTIVNGIDKVVNFLHNIIDDCDEENSIKIEKYKAECSKDVILKQIVKHPDNEFALPLDEDDKEWVKVEEVSDESYRNMREYFTWK